MRIVFCVLLLLTGGLTFAQDSQVNLLAQAESLLSKKDTAGAVSVFQHVLNQYPDSYPAALRLTEVYYLQENYRNAIQFSFLTEDILNRFIDSLRTKGTTDERDIQRARRYEYDLADIQMLKGKIRLKQNRPVDALHELNLSIQHTNQPEDVYIDIGLANIALGEYETARNAFQSSLSISKDNKGALFNMGNLYYAQNAYDRARHYYSLTQKLYPDFKWPLLYLGNISTQSGEYDSAIYFYSQYIDLDTTSQEAYFKRAVLYSETRQWENAISDWDAALKLDEADSEAWRNRGLAYFQLQEYKLALADFNKAIEIDPEPYTFINRGYTYYLMRDYDKALNDLNKGLENLEEYPLGYYLRALTHMRLKNKQIACEDLNEALNQGFGEAEVKDKKLRKTCL